MSLHLRSRRVGSDEAVYSTIDLFSTLLARLGKRSEHIFEGASPGRKARHAVIQRTMNTAIDVLANSPMAHLVRLPAAAKNVKSMINASCLVNLTFLALLFKGAVLRAFAAQLIIHVDE